MYGILFFTPGSDRIKNTLFPRAWSFEDWVFLRTDCAGSGNIFSSSICYYYTVSSLPALRFCLLTSLAPALYLCMLPFSLFFSSFAYRYPSELFSASIRCYPCHLFYKSDVFHRYCLILSSENAAIYTPQPRFCLLSSLLAVLPFCLSSSLLPFLKFWLPSSLLPILILPAVTLLPVFQFYCNWRHPYCLFSRSACCHPYCLFSSSGCRLPYCQFSFYLPSPYCLFSSSTVTAVTLSACFSVLLAVILTLCFAAPFRLTVLRWCRHPYCLFSNFCLSPSFLTVFQFCLIVILIACSQITCRHPVCLFSLFCLTLSLLLVFSVLPFIVRTVFSPTLPTASLGLFSSSGRRHSDCLSSS
jgi:hypothetical protein